jgi:RNA polymerase subunit RPABC4/transcription elongation factor Spt4
MKCKYCGAEVPKESQFCPNCGKDLSKLRKCVKCGEIIDDDATFCPHCGAEQPVYLEDTPSPWRKVIVIGIAIVVVAILGIGGYYFMNRKGQEPTKTENVATNDSLPEDSAKVADQQKVDSKESLPVPEFKQLMKIFMGEPSGMKSVKAKFSDFGLKEILDYSLVRPSDMDGQPDERHYYIVYGNNASFKIKKDEDLPSWDTSPEGRTVPLSNNIKPVRKNYIIVITMWWNYNGNYNDGYNSNTPSLDYLYVFSDNKSIMDKYIAAAKASGFKKDDSGTTGGLYKDLVGYVVYGAVNGSYYFGFESQH